MKNEKSVAVAEKKKPDSIEARLAEFKAQNYNIVLPSQTIAPVSEFHGVSYEIVMLSAKDDAYPQDKWRDNPQQYSLNKVGLLKIAHAAGIVWDPVRTGRVDAGNNRDYVAFKAVGGIQKQDGKWVTFTASTDMDLEVEEAELQGIYEVQAKDLKWNKNKADEQPYTDEQKTEWIARRVKTELLRRRKFKVPITETKAMLRVVRGLLALKQTFTPLELQKPFVVPRIVFKPDLSDPDIRKAVMMSGIKAIEQAYGTGDPLPGRPIEIHNHYDDLEPVVTGGDESDQNFGLQENAKPVVGEKSGDFFAEPSSTAEAITITTLEGFSALPKEKRAGALESIMKARNYDAALLNKPDIGAWPEKTQEQFCKLLLSRENFGQVEKR